MGLDPDSDVEVSTPLDPHEFYPKADSPPDIDVKLRDKVWQAQQPLGTSMWENTFVGNTSS